MNALVLLGFLFLVLLGAYLTFVAFASYLVTQCFSGKTEAGSYIFGTLAVIVWFYVYYFWPFNVVIKV